MQAEEKTTPRNRDEPATAALDSSVTPMARSSSSTTPAPGGSNPTPCTPFTRSSSSSSFDKNTVLLSDWWLVKAERGAGGKRLAVSGFTTRQQAVRVFTSAPIAKRYDAYTLETEDGITVIIQGMINKALTHDNGFPPEICNRFLVGFPYNWDYYADEYFRKSSTCSSNSSTSTGFGEPSKDSADGAGSTSSVCVKEFPLARICDILSSGGTLSRNFTENLRKFFRAPSSNPLHQKPLLAAEKCGDHEMDKSDQKHENGKGFATAINHDAGGHVTSHAEEGDHRNDIHAGDVLEENSNLNHDDSYDSLMHKSRETDSQPAAETASWTETGTTMQRETLFTKTRDVEKDHDLVIYVPMDCDNVDHVPACIEGKESAESRLESCKVEMKYLLKDSLPKESNLPNHEHDEEPENDAVRRQHCAEILRIPNVGVSGHSLVQKGYDPKNANSSKVKMTLVSENSPFCDVTKPLKVSMPQDDRTISKISSQNQVMMHSTILVARDGADSHHVERRGMDLNNLKSPNVDITRIPKDSSSNEIDDMCRSIFEKIESCKFPAARDPTSQIGSAVDMKSTSTSEVKESPTYKHLTKVVKKGRRKKENIQKEDQKCAECINSKVCLHFSMPAAQNSANEEKLTGRFSLCGTEELSSTGDVRDDVSLIVLRTRNVRRNSSASSEGKPVKSSTNVKADALSTRMKSSKKKGDDNRMAGCDPEVEKIGVSSVPMDHNIVNAANDAKHASRHKYTQGLAKVEKVSLESSPMKHGTKGVNYGIQPCSVPTPAATGVMHRQGDRHTNDCIGMNDVNENVTSKFPVKTTGPINTTGHLGTSLKEQTSNNKTLAMTGENIPNAPNDQNAKMSEVLIKEQPSGEKTLHTTRRKTAWRPISSVYQTPNTRGKAYKLSMASPESLNLKRSRSGRLIVPPLSNWCQQIIYDADGSIAGISGVDVLNSPNIGSKSEPVKKRKKFA